MTERWGVEQMHARRRGFTPTKKKGAGTIFYSSYWQKMGQPVLIRVGSTATGRCRILFLQIRAPIKPEAFPSSNYISEHPDCLIHSFHYEMKAVSFHSFPFTLHKKRTFIGTHPSCPWEISSTSNIQSFEEKKQWCGFSVYARRSNYVSDSFAQVLPLKCGFCIIKLSQVRQ